MANTVTLKRLRRLTLARLPRPTADYEAYPDSWFACIDGKELVGVLAENEDEEERLMDQAQKRLLAGGPSSAELSAAVGSLMVREIAIAPKTAPITVRELEPSAAVGFGNRPVQRKLQHLRGGMATVNMLLYTVGLRRRFVRRRWRWVLAPPTAPRPRRRIRVTERMRRRSRQFRSWFTSTFRDHLSEIELPWRRRKRIRFSANEPRRSLFWLGRAEQHQHRLDRQHQTFPVPTQGLLTGGGKTAVSDTLWRRSFRFSPKSFSTTFLSKYARLRKRALQMGRMRHHCGAHYSVRLIRRRLRRSIRALMRGYVPWRPSTTGWELAREWRLADEPKRIELTRKLANRERLYRGRKGKAFVITLEPGSPQLKRAVDTSLERDYAEHARRWRLSRVGQRARWYRGVGRARKYETPAVFLARLRWRLRRTRTLSRYIMFDRMAQPLLQRQLESTRERRRGMRALAAAPRCGGAQVLPLDRRDATGLAKTGELFDREIRTAVVKTLLHKGKRARALVGTGGAAEAPAKQPLNGKAGVQPSSLKVALPEMRRRLRGPRSGLGFGDFLAAEQDLRLPAASLRAFLEQAPTTPLRNLRVLRPKRSRRYIRAGRLGQRRRPHRWRFGRRWYLASRGGPVFHTEQRPGLNFRRRAVALSRLDSRLRAIQRGVGFGSTFTGKKPDDQAFERAYADLALGRLPSVSMQEAVEQNQGRALRRKPIVRSLAQQRCHRTPAPAPAPATVPAASAASMMSGGSNPAGGSGYSRSRRRFSSGVPERGLSGTTTPADPYIGGSEPEDRGVEGTDLVDDPDAGNANSNRTNGTNGTNSTNGTNKSLDPSTPEFYEELFEELFGKPFFDKEDKNREE
jgi:hypothetical protein